MINVASNTVTNGNSFNLTDEMQSQDNDALSAQRTRAVHPQPWCGQHVSNSDNSNKNFYNYTNQDEKDKTPMCRIAELARFHRLKHEYKLMDESGPAHKKLFTVQLVLTHSEVYEGSGASIKKAQQAAADEALKKTTLEMPPEKNSKKKKDQLSPVQLLSHVAWRLKLPEPVYQTFSPPKMPRTRIQDVMPVTQAVPVVPPFTSCIDPSQPPPILPRPAGIPSSPPNVLLSPTGNLTPLAQNMQLVNGTPLSPPRIPPGIIPGGRPLYPGFNPHEKGHIVSVMIGPGRIFNGFGATTSQARLNAAGQALLFLGPAIQQLDARLRAEEMRKKAASVQNTANGVEKLNSSEDSVQNSENNGVPAVPRHRQKSVISHIHECALQLKLNVEFEVVSEDGPPHERSYVMKCALLNQRREVVLEELGRGRKKKEATQAACEAIVGKLQEFENSPVIVASNLFKLQRKTSAQKENKRKTIVKDMKMDPSYGHQINPVSRLLQVLQARGESEPVFSLVAEHGQNRYKEFIMEVSCCERTCSGSGPNKRLAKRAAAEAMLTSIGYVKPLPSPGKSLLKKKEPMMEIGVFDPSQCDFSVQPEDPDSANDSKQLPTETNCYQEPEKTWDLTVDPVSSVDSVSDSSSGHASPSNTVPSPNAKRRVTFSNQVKACPPPEDENYPEPELAPLKADVVVEGRLKRMRKVKEGKRSLSEEQKAEIADLAREFMIALNVFSAENRQSAHQKLDDVSEKFKFSVQYTNFPKSPDGDNQTYFALVSLGLEQPLVCHGSGATVEGAAENAAQNAISSLAKLNIIPESQCQISPTPSN